MALPVLERVRTALPQVQTVYTFFSPSAEAFAQSLGADFTDYLPFDSTTAMRAVLDALVPTALVFSKGDVWPILMREATVRHVRTGLVSASVPERSRRAQGMSVAITHEAYGALDAIGAASQADARQLVRAGAHADRIRVTGDTRYDQAWTRAHTAPRNAAVIAALESHRPTLVAGSTWPADDAELLKAWLHVRASVPGARLVIAPHELHASHLAALEGWARGHALTIARLDMDTARDADVVLVDRMGVLADLYALADAAYVGGGFHDAGLHSLVEPAVFRVPAVIGPRHTKSRDAALMLAAGGVVSADDADALARAITRLLGDSLYRAAMSDAMGVVVASELGAADRSFEIVRELLGAV
jgi:3-deoxy-D-manno-octulosonic-acid transferase